MSETTILKIRYYWMSSSMSSYEKTLDVIFGRCKNQTLYAVVKLGVFDNVTPDPKEAVQITMDLGLDDALGYRLLWALASLGFLKEEPGIRFP
jgi:hypothetical protein